jgi:hypothetical protein
MFIGLVGVHTCYGTYVLRVLCGTGRNIVEQVLGKLGSPPQRATPVCIPLESMLTHQIRAVESSVSVADDYDMMLL